MKRQILFFLLQLLTSLQFTFADLALANEQLSAPEQLIQVTRGFDLVAYGEIHSIPEQAEFLQEYLLLSTKSHTFSALATEFVLASMNSQFQAYLTSPSAEIDSQEERHFFSEIRKAGYIWINTEADRNTLRAYRLYKLANPDTKICGIDHNISDHVSSETNSQIWHSFSAALKNLVRTVSGLSDSDILDPSKFSLREAAMAQSTVDCIQGASRAFIHAGGGHTKVLVRDDDTNVNFQNMFGYVSELLPQLSRVSVFNSTSSDSLGAYRFYRRIYQELHLQQPTVFSLSDLQSSQGASLVDRFDGRSRADFYILGVSPSIIDF